MVRGLGLVVASCKYKPPHASVHLGGLSSWQGSLHRRKEVTQRVVVAIDQRIDEAVEWRQDDLAPGFKRLTMPEDHRFGASDLCFVLYTQPLEHLERSGEVVNIPGLLAVHTRRNLAYSVCQEA